MRKVRGPNHAKKKTLARTQTTTSRTFIHPPFIAATVLSLLLIAILPRDCSLGEVSVQHIPEGSLGTLTDLKMGGICSWGVRHLARFIR